MQCLHLLHFNKIFEGNFKSIPGTPDHTLYDLIKGYLSIKKFQHSTNVPINVFE